MKYTQPLSIYVVWHPDFEVGATFANAIFRQFCRDFAHPSARGIGIPVFFRSLPPVGIEMPAPPLEIDLDDASQTIIFAFVESNMVNADDWDIYLGKIANDVSKDGSLHKLFPITMSGTPMGIHKDVDVLNCIRLSEEVIPEDALREPIIIQKTKELLFAIAVELCKAIGLQAEPPTSRLQLFLSHARRDGGSAARKINDYIRTKTSIESYLDVLSIRPGSDFRTEIEKGVKESSVLVWLSDAYASRDWCRKEVLFAKKHSRPILVVNALKRQELRSFPYLGNVPTIRWRFLVKTCG